MCTKRKQTVKESSSVKRLKHPNFDIIGIASEDIGNTLEGSQIKFGMIFTSDCSIFHI